MTQRTAVVTGASSGIGAATVRRLAAEGFRVVAGARRRELLDRLAAEHPGVEAVQVDVTDDSSVTELVDAAGRCDVLVCNAGAAFDMDLVADADPDSWLRTFDLNVVGSVRSVRAFLPLLERGVQPQVILMGSTAGRWSYEGGGSYVAAKRAVVSLREILRLELAAAGIRVCEVAPGMVGTEEFNLNRFDGDAQRAAGHYAGVRTLDAEDVAEAIAWIVSRPAHVNVDVLNLTPQQQAAVHKVLRAVP